MDPLARGIRQEINILEPNQPYEGSNIFIYLVLVIQRIDRNPLIYEATGNRLYIYIRTMPVFKAAQTGGNWLGWGVYIITWIWG